MPRNVAFSPMQRDIAFSNETADKAIELVLPTILGMMKSKVVKRGHMHIVVSWAPPDNAHTNSVPIAERSLGDIKTWQSDYKEIAEAKERIVARIGKSSREVVEDHPYLLLEGEPVWPGGVIVGDVIIAVSGVEAEFDEALAYMIAHMIIALRYNAEQLIAASASA